MYLFMCYACSNAFQSITALQSHMQRHNNLGELPCPIKCCQGTCRSTFTKVFNFIRHLNSYHNVSCAEGADLEKSSTLNAQSVGGDEFDNDCADELPHIHSKGAVNCLQDLTAEGTALVACLRANSSIPYGIIPGIVESCNHMVNCVVTNVQNEILKTLEDSDVSRYQIGLVEVAMARQAETLHKPLDFLSTRYKQDKYFDEHPLHV
jgi:hypothetical protein